MDKLVQKCLVPGCEFLTNNCNIAFFNFPTLDRSQIRVWNKALGFRANCKHIPDPKVCEKHFDESEIDKSVLPMKLKINAVPSIGLVSTSNFTENEIASSSSSNTSLAAGEPNYCRLCAKLERQPFKNSIQKMMKCSDTAKLLDICLADGRNNTKLPNGACDACCHMMKFLMKFIKNCCGAQYKLSKIYSGKDQVLESQDMEPATDEVETPIKSEVDEVTAELPTDYLEIGMEKQECHETSKNVLEEIIADNEICFQNKSRLTYNNAEVKKEPDGNDSDSEFDSSRVLQGSSSEGESYTDNDYESEELIVKQDNAVCMKFENDKIVADNKIKKRRGRPKKNVLRHSSETISRKPRGIRDKNMEDKPASLCKQICQVCGKILSSTATFNVHMMTHTQQKDIVCPICERRFYVKQQLKIHIESIHEKKDFVCNICGLKCRWRKSLRRHMLLHDDNPYKHKCTYCDKAFARPNQLRYHVMKHTGDRVYCEICGADYRFNYMLTQHKIRKHGIVVEGVQLYKQSARKKKSESGDLNTRRTRMADASQTNIQIQQSVMQQATVALPTLSINDHDRTNRSDLSHSTDLGSPATNVSFTTINSPEQFPNHTQSHSGLQTHHQHQPLHQQTHHTNQLIGFNGTGLNMSLPQGLIGFPTMERP
ncbi:myoneurin-like [Sabethes cyaneus]|uniref:myoneurin-like n=1 Tax=Sabethes cyaneus TaxID=53552 RepID=UPI00237EA328|nr:myoneurin-like [Sabethes cyaneus]